MKIPSKIITYTFLFYIPFMFFCTKYLKITIKDSSFTVFFISLILGVLADKIIKKIKGKKEIKHKDVKDEV